MKITKVNLFAAITLSLIVLQGCSTTSTVGTSAGVGTGIGAGVGALADPGSKGQNRFRNVVIGSAVGTILGVGAGIALDQNNRNQKENGKKEAQKEAEEELKKKNVAGATGNEPRLVPPKTEAKWIPEQVKGSTYIPGHFEYLIVQPAHWEGN